MRPYFPGGTLNALAAAPREWIPPTPSAHRLRRGLPGYLILFAPHAFVPQRQLPSRESLSPPVFLVISTHFTANQEFHSPLRHSSRAVSSALPGLSPGLSRQTCTAAYAPFTPSDSEQRLHLPSYRGCWHGIGRCFLRWYRHGAWLFAKLPFFPPDRALRPEGLHHPRGVAGSGLRPLPNIPHCCLP